MSSEVMLYNQLKDSLFAPLFHKEQEGVEQSPNPNSEGVVVLSGHGLYNPDGQPITWDSPENQIRIYHGVRTYLKIAKLKLGKEHPSKEDVLSLGTGDRPFYLYLNGEYHDPKNERNQLPDMFEIIESLDFPQELIVAQNNVIGEQYNTLTQFRTINEDPILGTAKHITLVTSDYHAVRTAGTAEINLNPSIQFDIAPAPQFIHEQDVFKTLAQIGGEISRIITYSSKTPPDVSTTLTRGRIL